MTVLCFDKVSKSFRSDFRRQEKQVLDAVDFEVNEGETFAYLGHNGAGKTTSIKALLGLIRVDSGEIRLLGRSPGDRRALARIGYVPEKPYFYDHLSGREFLQLVADLHDVPRREARQKIDEVLELVSMTKQAGQRMRTYSKGMLQRIGLGQALINDPDFLVLDEPMGGLDPMGRHHIRTIISELKARRKTIFMSSHILADVEVVADRAAILSDGRVRRIVDLDDRSMDTRGLEVQCRAMSSEGEEDLARAGFELQRNNDVVRVRVSDRDRVGQVIGMIQSSGGYLLQVSPIRMDLEKIFIEEVASSDVNGSDSNVDPELDAREHVRRILDHLVTVRSRGEGEDGGREAAEREQVRS